MDVFLSFHGRSSTLANILLVVMVKVQKIFESRADTVIDRYYYKQLSQLLCDKNRNAIGHLYFILTNNDKSNPYSDLAEFTLMKTGKAISGDFYLESLLLKRIGDGQVVVKEQLHETILCMILLDEEKKKVPRALSWKVAKLEAGDKLPKAGTFQNAHFQDSGPDSTFLKPSCAGDPNCEDSAELAFCGVDHTFAWYRESSYRKEESGNIYFDPEGYMVCDEEDRRQNPHFIRSAWGNMFLDRVGDYRDRLDSLYDGLVEWEGNDLTKLESSTNMRKQLEIQREQYSLVARFADASELQDFVKRSILTLENEWDVMELKYEMIPVIP